MASTYQMGGLAGRALLPVMGLSAGLMVACVKYFPPPVQPDPELLGCWSLDTNLPESYADSLGYRVPDLIQLGYNAGGQWTVVPTDEEWHPRWTVYDELASGHKRRVYGTAATGPLQWDSVNMIPGDSIDVLFPSAMGTLGLRLGRQGPDLVGRAEWSVRFDQLHLNDGTYVRAQRSDCEGLPMALERTRYK